MEINNIKIKFFDIVLVLFLLFQLPLGNSSISMANISSILIICIYIINLKKYSITTIPKFDIVIGIFYFITFIAFIRVIDFKIVRSDFIRLTYLLGMCLIIRSILRYRLKVDNVEIINYLATLLLAMGTLNAVMIILQFLLPNIFKVSTAFYYNGESIIRPSGFIEPNFSNLIITFGLMSCIYYLNIARNKKIYIALLILLITSNIITISRTGLIINLFLLIYCFFKFTYRCNLYKKILVNISFLSILFLGIQYIINNISTLINKYNFIRLMYIRFEEMFLIKGSAGSRNNLISLSIEIFNNNPLFGKGFFSTRIIDPRGQVSHNTFLQIMADLGVIGLIFFGIILSICLYYIFRIKNFEERNFLILIFITILYYMMLLTLIDKTVLIIFIAFFPLIMSKLNRAKGEKI